MGPLGDIHLLAVARGTDYPVLVVHGVPGIDHHEFGDSLDPPRKSDIPAMGRVEDGFKDEDISKVRKAVTVILYWLFAISGRKIDPVDDVGRMKTFPVKGKEQQDPTLLNGQGDP